MAGDLLIFESSCFLDKLIDLTKNNTPFILRLVNIEHKDVSICIRVINNIFYKLKSAAANEIVYYKLRYNQFMVVALEMYDLLLDEIIRVEVKKSGFPVSAVVASSRFPDDGSDFYNLYCAAVSRLISNKGENRLDEQW